jgi:hypothetical protein
MKSQQSESSLTKQSNVFRWFGFVVAVGCVAVGAGAMAVGLIVPSWDIFKLSPKVPPAKALAFTGNSSDANSVSAVARAPRSVELIVRSDTPSKYSDGPTTSPLNRIPAVSSQDAESTESGEPVPDSNVPTAPPATVVPREPLVDSAIATPSQDSDAPVATSGIAAASPTSPPEVESKSPPATPPRDSPPMRSVQNVVPTLAVHKSRSHGGPTIGQRMWYK